MKRDLFQENSKIEMRCCHSKLNEIQEVFFVSYFCSLRCFTAEVFVILFFCFSISSTFLLETRRASFQDGIAFFRCFSYKVIIISVIAWISRWRTFTLVCVIIYNLKKYNFRNKAVFTSVLLNYQLSTAEHHTQCFVLQ